MAKRRTGIQLVRSFPSVARPAPIIIRQSAARPKKVRHRRRRSGGASGGRTLVAIGMGGALLGFLEKSFPALPTLPIIGRAGTIALAAHFIGKHVGGSAGGIIRDIGLAAAAIAGHELGATGKISGIDGDIPDQITGGIASQV